MRSGDAGSLVDGDTGITMHISNQMSKPVQLQKQHVEAARPIVFARMPSAAGLGACSSIASWGIRIITITVIIIIIVVIVTIMITIAPVAAGGQKERSQAAGEEQAAKRRRQGIQNIKML